MLARPDQSALLLVFLSIFPITWEPYMPIVENRSIHDGEEYVVYIEVDEVPQAGSPYENLRGSDRVVTAARDLFGDGLELARYCATHVVENIKKMGSAVRPEEFQVQLAIKLDSEVGAVIAKTTAGAQLQVTMKWVNKP